MSKETLVSEKAEWAEKKRHGSRREKRAAASVQAARIINKLLERSKDLNYTSHEYPNNALTITKSFKGASDNKKEAVSTSSWDNWNLGEEKKSVVVGTEEYAVKPILRKERVEEAAVISTSGKDMLSSHVGYSRLEVDPKGKRKPLVTHSHSSDGWQRSESSYVPDAETIVGHATPKLYQIKKGIDAAEAEQKRKAA